MMLSILKKFWNIYGHLLFCFLMAFVGYIMFISKWSCISFSSLNPALGYFIGYYMLFFGLIGLSFDKSNLFQQQAFRFMTICAIIIIVLTLSFSIAIEIISNIIKVKTLLNVS